MLRFSSATLEGDTLADPNTRTGKRTPVTLKIKFKSETIEQFIERYAVDVSQGGIFIRTKEPLAVGTAMKFEFQLRDASPLIAGEGTVVWTRENDPSRPAIAPGMGVRFDKLADGSPSVLERILSEKAKQHPQRSASDSTKPPLFVDTPTRVAPAPQGDLLSGGANRALTRSRADSEQTPLPKPMPFHSDADEFPEEAFEEATKVRSLEDLVAQTAQTDAGDAARDLFGNGPGSQTSIIPADELALRRQQARNDDEAAASSPLIEPPSAVVARVIDRDSAPVLPSPPVVEASGRSPRLLDTTPSPRADSALASDIPPSRTRIGVEPAKVDTKPGHAPNQAATAASAAVAMVSAPARAASTSVAPSRSRSGPTTGAVRAITEEPVRPVKAGSIMPIVIAVIAVVAAAAAAVWFFVLKETINEDELTKVQPRPPVVVPPTPGSNALVETGSAGRTGSATAAVVTNGSAGSAAAMVTPGVKTVDTIIGSTVEKATVTLDEPALSGPAPFTVKLEPGKTYKAHVAAPGYATLDLDIKGGQTGISATLVAKTKLLTVTSEPAGAQIMIDGVGTGHVTPFDIDLKPFAGKARVKVTLRKSGYRQLDETVDVSAPSDAGGKLTVTAPSATLALTPVVVRPPTPHPPTPGSDSVPDPTPGSAATPPDPTPTPTPTPPTTPTPTPAGEPEPTFNP